MMYVLDIDGERHECPTIEKLAEAIFDNGAESEEMCDEFWSIDDGSLCVTAKDAMLRHVFHGSSIPVEILAHHVLTKYLRVVRSAVYALDRGEVDAVEWENGDCGTVSVHLEDDE